MLDLGPVGGLGGTAFDDAPPSAQMEIGGIFIRSGWYIDQLQVLYRNPSSAQLALGPTHGGSGGDLNVFVLNPGEFITQVSGRSGKYVDAITFLTNQGRTSGIFGGGGGGNYQFPAQLQPNLEVFGFFGRSGQYIDSIGFHTRQLSSQLIANVAIAGVEATQAIQYWNTPTGQGSGIAANNSIPLVSERDTILRVYAISIPNGAKPLPATLTGVVTVSGFSQALGYGITLDLQPIGGPITAKPLANVQRSSATDTLNFRIPAGVSKGNIHCDVRVFDPAQPSNSAETFLDLNFTLVPKLGVYEVLIHYTGVDYYDKPVDAQPTNLDLALTLDWVSRTYPIPGINFNGSYVISWSDKLAVTQNFHNLKRKVDALRAMSSGNDIYVGVIPPSAGCGGVCGLGGNMSALFFAGNGRSAAHEIGHALGRAHTQCAMRSEGADSNYPNYDAYPQGSIGEYGFDVFSLTTFDPRTTFDFMSYCLPPWISPYTYLGLMNTISATFQTTQAPVGFGPPSIWDDQIAEFLYLQLRLHRNPQQTHVEVRNAFSITGVPPRPAFTLPSSIVVELVDSDDNLVDSYPVALMDPHQDENDAFRDVEVTIPVLSDISRIRVVEQGSVLATLQPAKNPPRLEITEMTHVQERDILYLQWQAKADPKADPKLQYGLRYSNNGGKTWRGLGVGLTENSQVLNLALLPGGSECRVQVIASAGIRSAIAETTLFEVTQKPRQAHILFPKEDNEFEYGEVVPLVGVGFSPDYGTAPLEDTVWTSNVRGVIGFGYRLPMHGLPAGRHIITLHVPDGQGGEALIRELST